MSGLYDAPEAPAVVRYNRNAIDQIIQCVQDGTYCALLGPRLSGKTVLLRFVARTLAESLGWTCVYLDLYAVRASTLQGFFAELIRLTAGGIQELTGLTLPVPEAGVASSAVFRGFLADAVTQLECDLVLIIEHLEALPTDMVEALLTSLRAAYMDQQTQEHQVMVVVSGALSLAALTVGESSPFRGIARRVFVGDLSRSDSRALIAERIAAGGIAVSRRAKRRLVRATSGDPYLIRQLCQRCADHSRTTAQRLRARDVKRIVRRFLRDEVYGYAPLQEAVRLIEEDPDLLRCVLLLLAHGLVATADLPLPLSPDVDPLYLTGVVEQVGPEHYRIQNLIYSRFLAQHFDPGRVGHLLAMAGLWDSAIDYLEAGISEGNEQSRSDLLPATIHSMYASEDVAQAAHFMIRGLSAAFGVVEARVWCVPSQENCLRLVGFLGPKAESATWTRPEMSIAADRLEARAYRQARALRGREGERYVWRVIPLLSPGQKPIGVVTVCEDLQGGQFVAQRERELQLLGYLNQAARAIQAVSTRRQELALAGRMQASLLPAVPTEPDGWQLAATLRPARETSCDFYDFIPLPGGRLGLVIADVADKGMGAALYMALSRTLIRTYAADYPDRPDLTLRVASQRILADTEASLFVTVFYGILDPAAGTLNYCNAGHPPPFLLNVQNGGSIQALPGRGMALGVVEDITWGHTVIQLDPGAALLLYTDGVLDAQNPQQERFGSEAMLEVAQTYLGRSAQDLQNALLTQVQQFMGDEPQFDDITLIVARRGL
jgi:serine phosphatase RsbU (regulator of sigma subunit)/type II secretory pathway predicted ATPase ExeA